MSTINGPCDFCYSCVTFTWLRWWLLFQPRWQLLPTFRTADYLHICTFASDTSTFPPPTCHRAAGLRHHLLTSLLNLITRYRLPAALLCLLYKPVTSGTSLVEHDILVRFNFETLMKTDYTLHCLQLNRARVF